MLFHSLTFFIFFAVFYPVFLALKQSQLRMAWLLIASGVFYGWRNPWCLFLILITTTTDYVAVRIMARTGRKRLCVFLAVAINLGLLAFFKYAGFFANSFNAVLSGLNLSFSLPVPHGVLPVGISFFVFQSMNYTIDFYRGEVPEEKDILRYATFVSFFPPLLAGPIGRAKAMLPQFGRPLILSREDVTDGISLFVLGLFKKMVLADALALYVDKIYGAPDAQSGLTLLAATFAFAWQVYFDFSGYTDMARGVARVMGIRLMLNFNHPYLATGLGEFWSRWHISLSTWFRDYLYVSLGGNRKGPWRTYVNMSLTMVLSGLWHGAQWTYVVWGALHALGRVLTRELERSRFYQERVPGCVKQAWVFSFVSFCWIFFRAETIGDAWTILKRIVTAGWGDPGFPLILLGLISSVWLYELIEESRYRTLLEWKPLKIGLSIGMILVLLLASSSGQKGFIYFQF